MITSNGGDANIPVKGVGGKTPNSSACITRTNYESGRCRGTFIASSLADLDSYVAGNYGKNDRGNFKSLRISGNLGKPGEELDIESPCRISLDRGVQLNGSLVSLDGLDGVSGKRDVRIIAHNNACVLSGNGPASLGDQAQAEAGAMTVLAAEAAIIGQRSTLTIGGALTLKSLGATRSSDAMIGADSLVSAESVALSATGQAIIAQRATVEAVGAVTVQSTGDTKKSQAWLADGSRVSAQSLSLSSPLTTVIGKKAQVDIRGDLTMESTGKARHCQALINTANVKVGGDMALTSAANASVSFAAKLGNCAPFLP